MYLKLRQERLSRRWTQQFVADSVGVSKQTIHDIETGRRKPSYSVLLGLEELFETGHRNLMKEVEDQ